MPCRRRTIARALVSAASLAAASRPALAQVDPNSGIDFVRVGAVGNAPWTGDGTVGDRAVGRGGVNYEYSIGRFEVTTAQWTEFFNAAFDRPANDRLPHLIPPDLWGAVPTAPTVSGGRRWRVPAGNEMRPVGNISWRMAAMYCNFLHNDRRTDREAFLNGAYDVGTFGYQGNVFTDQLAHHPDARYWIPTLDEWIKAAHYDPNRPNPDGSLGGYWRYSHSSDAPLVYGAPGILVNGQPTQANAGWEDFQGTQFTILLGAYPSVRSPWGLLDVAGGASEWTEGIVRIAGFNQGRMNDGSFWGTSPGPANAIDTVYFGGSTFPSSSTIDLGFRIASNVPGPGPCALALVFIVTGARRPNRNGRIPCVEHSGGTVELSGCSRC